MSAVTATAGNHVVELGGEAGVFAAELTTEKLAEGLWTARLVLTADVPAEPVKLSLTFRHPIADLHGMWTPRIDTRRELGGGVSSAAASCAPVISTFSLAGANRLTFAASDAMNALKLVAHVQEETAELRCRVDLFVAPSPPIDRYAVSLRIDTRDIPFHQALADVADWWAAQSGYTPAPVPDFARRPMYSTWYSLHQNLTVGRVVDQCRLARDLGCEAVIVDDGWQTDDSSRGYAYCGDWKPVRIPEMAAFVEKVHQVGMKFLLWYSVPHMGKRAEHWDQFKDKLLGFNEHFGAGNLDPRFPDVREYLIGVYEAAVRDWGLDGFKFDFVAGMSPSEKTPAHTPGDGRDHASVSVAADKLMSDVMTRLRALRPDIAVEFRQWYNGPLMRKYGNMLRAVDCPNDAVTNRVRIVDVRLLAGRTATHSDMLMWHKSDPVESAALQLLNVLFSVPQISVLLDELPGEHVEMLRFYLRFWCDHRDVLLDGEFEPRQPMSLYPVVAGWTDRQGVLAVYDDAIVRIDRDVAELAVVNATQSHRVILDVTAALGTRQMTVHDCRGRVVATGPIDLPAGPHRIDVPPAGLVTLV